MKRGFVICFTLLCSLFSFNKGYCQDSIAKQSFSYGIKANSYLTDPSFGIDYSLYCQYKFIGIMGGYTNLSNQNTSISDNPIKLKGFNAGLILKLSKNNRKDGFHIYIYDVYSSGFSKYYSIAGPVGGTYNPGTFYKESINFVMLNPRYKIPFWKSVFALELGLGFSYGNQNIVYQKYQNGKNSIYVAFGANICLSFNPSALFHKR